MSNNLQRALEVFCESWHFSDRTNLEAFKPSPTDHAESAIEVLLSYGWGNERGPLGITKDYFEALCMTWRLHPGIFENISPFNPDVPQFLEYEIEYENPSSGESFSRSPRATALSFTFRMDIRIHTYITCFCRYNIDKNELKALVFSCGLVGRQDHGIPNLQDFAQYLQERQTIFQKNPLRLIGLLFKLCEGRFRLDLSTICQQLFQTEGMIGVTKRPKWYAERDFPEVSKNYSKINARLYKNQVDLGRTQSRGLSLRAFGRDFEAMLEDFKGQSDNEGRASGISIYGPSKDIRDTQRRIDVDTLEIEHAQKRLQSQFSILYNLINQRDSRLNYSIAASSKQDSSAMKAISILTLTFLPSTFVSTVFSTTIFDFQNWQSESGGVSSTTNGGGRVASPGWWIYLVCCVLLTALVFAIWFPWDRWSSRKFALENRPEDMEAQREDEDIVVDWASIS